MAFRGEGHGHPGGTRLNRWHYKVERLTSRPDQAAVAGGYATGRAEICPNPFGKEIKASVPAFFSDVCRRALKLKALQIRRWQFKEVKVRNNWLNSIAFNNIPMFYK